MSDNAFSNGPFSKGISKREYFAGQALIGILSGYHRVLSPEDAAKYAYTVADAMIKEGNTETT